MRKILKLMLVISVLSIILSGCFLNIGSLKTVNKSVELNEATKVKADFNMFSGKFSLAKGSTKLMDGVFTYNVNEWEPAITYAVTAGQGNLSVYQPGVQLGKINFSRNEWQIKLNENVPLDLSVSLGSGEGNLDLGGLYLNSLNLEMGTGNSEVSFIGKWNNDLYATIVGGIGKVKVYLPTDVGVRVEAKGSWGNVDSGMMKKDGDYYINSVYGQTAKTLYISIQTGIGEIELVLGK